MDNMNIANAPKTGTFQIRINTEIKDKLENIFAQNGLSLTDAINIFLQQSLNSNGLPFLASPENIEFMRAKAVDRLMSELQKGLDSGAQNGWISEEDAAKILGIDE